MLAEVSGFRHKQIKNELLEKYTTAESDFFHIEGMDVHYRKTGNGPALLLVHGVCP